MDSSISKCASGACDILILYVMHGGHRPERSSGHVIFTHIKPRRRLRH